MFLDRIDAVPLSNNDFTFAFNQWIAVLIDTLNENLKDIEDAINASTVRSYTAAEIATLDPDLSNGVILYDTTNNVYVGKQNGTLVQFDTSSYP